MVTEKVMTMMYLFNQKANVSDAITLLVGRMSCEELAEVKNYIKHGTFLESEFKRA